LGQSIMAVLRCLSKGQRREVLALNRALGAMVWGYLSNASPLHS
jgi:hypothetical protein